MVYQKAEVFDFYYNGIAVFTYPYAQDVVVKISVEVSDEGIYKTQTFRTSVLGYIPYNNIIDYDLDGDEFYMYPHVFCDFANGDNPYEFIRYAISDERGFYVLDDSDIVEVLNTDSL